MQPLETQRLINDPNRVSLLHRRYSYRARGCYLDQLRRWEKHFSRDGLLVVISEQLFREPAMVLPRVHTFLGLTEADPATFLPANVGTVRQCKDGASDAGRTRCILPGTQRRARPLPRYRSWLGLTYRQRRTGVKHGGLVPESGPAPHADRWIPCSGGIPRISR